MEQHTLGKEHERKCDEEKVLKKTKTELNPEH